MKLDLFFLPIFLFILGCSDSTIYRHTVVIPDQTWTYEDDVHFEFDIQDTSSLYALNLDIVHSTEYSFQNLYVKIFTNFPNDSVKEDVVSLELAGENSLWHGSCRSGKCKVTIPLQEKTYFASQGTYGMNISQYMRQDSMDGIQSISLSLSKL